MKVINISHIWGEVNTSHARKKQMVKAGVSAGDVKKSIDMHNTVVAYYARKKGIAVAV